jgi:cyclopropane fatty-acyl-phospholipid synthase-like methyltransferase
MDSSQRAATSSAADSSAIYSDGRYRTLNETWHVEDSAWKAQQITGILRANRLEPARFCEVGCGAGEILRHVSAAFPAARLVGYEMSPQALELCRKVESERVTFRLQDITKEEVRFDCLLCIDVIEHVEDYLGFVRALKPKAEHKIFHIPLEVYALSVLRAGLLAGRKQWGHLHYFTRETALATLTDCGYDIVDVRYTKWFADTVHKTLKGRLAKFPRQALFSLSPDWAVRILGGCSLLVLAR